jgi:tRNA (cytidine56-2'-O)-methyltransferase
LVTVLRIGHRIKRDKRISTHLALVARAWGVRRIIFTGEKDENLIESVKKINQEWGGNFKIESLCSDEWKTIIMNWKTEKKKIIHLTMYGENLAEFEKTEEFKGLKKNFIDLEEILIVVGGKKVPGKVFNLANWNIAVGNQPHSEVGALAVFLDHLMPNNMRLQFDNANKRIIPSIEGKKVYMEKTNEN